MKEFKEKAEQEIEEIREWIQDKNLNQVSFDSKQNMPRIRTFKNNEVKDPAYSFIRSLQLLKQKQDD